jgi:hypothetical protein
VRANRRVPIAVLALALFAAAPPATAVAPPGADRAAAPPRVIPPEAGRIAGRTYGGWSAAWWRQAFALPAGQNPLTETGPADCGLGGGRVRFLFGTFTTTEQPSGNIVGRAHRRCAVPAGTLLFLPSINGECSTAEGTRGTPAALRACAKAQADAIDPADLRLSVDGVALTTHRAVSPIFTFRLPRRDILGKRPQRARAAADGYWAMLAPLEPRAKPHVVVFGGSVAVPGDQPITFTTRVTYRITVVPR